MKLALLTALAAAAGDVARPGHVLGLAVHPLWRPGRRLPVRRPGAAEQARHARPDGRQARALHGRLAPDRDQEAAQGGQPGRPGLRLDERGRGAAGAAQAQDRRAGDALRHAAWANGGRGANGVPTSKWSLSAFALAVAKRYPWIRMWEVWNEPNLRSFLSPNSPALYVGRLLDPTVAVLHAGACRQPHRRRRHFAAADAVRALAGRLHARHAGSTRPARRLLASPLPGHAARAAERLLPQHVQVLQGRADAREPARPAEGGASMSARKPRAPRRGRPRRYGRRSRRRARSRRLSPGTGPSMPSQASRPARCTWRGRRRSRRPPARRTGASRAGLSAAGASGPVSSR